MVSMMYSGMLFLLPRGKERRSYMGMRRVSDS